MKNLKTLLLISVLSVTILSCGKEGPQGPTGNANVVPRLFDVSNWNYDGNNNDWYAVLVDPDISDDITNNGLVEVFLQTGFSPNPIAYTALPLTAYNNTSVSSSYTYTFSSGQVEIDVTSSDLSASYEPNESFFKVIAISASGRMEAQKKGINLNDYNEVIKLAKHS